MRCGDNFMTIYDSAKAVNVSPSTVSRVLNNKPGVNAETRKRILKYLDDQHYSPNESARGLATKSSKLIGILMGQSKRYQTWECMQYLEPELTSDGYGYIVYSECVNDEIKVEKIKTLSQRRVEATVMIGSTFESKAVENAIQKYLTDVPVFMTNGYLDLPNVYSVLTDEQNGMINCVKLLASKGRRRLAYINGETSPGALRRQEGFSMGMKLFFPQTEEIIFESEYSIDCAGRVTIDLIKKYPDIDGIIYSDDMLAAGGIHALFQNNITVPDQISVIGVNNSIYTQICRPTITALETNIPDVNQTVSRLLTDRLHGKKISKRTMILSSIVEREST